MTKAGIIFGAILAMLLIGSVAFAAPSIPNRFHGNVNFLNGPAPDGLSIDAKIGGAAVASTTTYKGTYGYAPNVFDITDPDNNRAGKTISFSVNGLDTGKTAIFTNGESSTLDFTINGYVNELPATNEPIINQIIAVNQTSPAKVTVGDSLSITIASQASGIATIQNITKLSDSFFSGAYAIPSGKNELNAFEIKISGDVTITVTMKYDDTGIDESTIVPYRYDGTNWVALPLLSRDTASNTITFSISSAQTPYAIMGSQLSNNGGGTGGGGTGGGGGYGGSTGTTTPAICSSNWSCSDWSSCVNGIQTRSCTDTKNCGTTENRPALSQSCTSPAPPAEKNASPTTNAAADNGANIPSAPTGFFLTSTAGAGAVAVILIIIAAVWYVKKKRSRK